MSDDKEDDAVDEIWTQKTMRRSAPTAAAKASATADFISEEHGTMALMCALMRATAGGRLEQLEPLERLTRQSSVKRKLAPSYEASEDVPMEPMETYRGVRLNTGEGALSGG